MKWGKSDEQIDFLKKDVIALFPDAVVYLFGSRVDDEKKGGGIDILLVPKDTNKTNSLKLSLQIQAKFFSVCE